VSQRASRRSTIGPHVTIAGEVSSDVDLSIEGTVNGVVFVRGATLTIAQGAKVEADVRAAEVLVEGEVHGGISATERIELRPSSSVEGSLSAGRIAISDGARFNGQIDMGRRTIAALVAEYRASRPPEAS
jgi:cytoskeletal protein CcmA (bactofilin family)